MDRLQSKVIARARITRPIQLFLTMTESQQPTRLLERKIGWDKHEQQAIPAALNAAMFLQIIQEPTRLDSTLPGRIVIKALESGNLVKVNPYEGRMLDRLFDPPNDDYFIFDNEQHRPLSLREVEADMTPQALRLKLYPAEIRV